MKTTIRLIYNLAQGYNVLLQELPGLFSPRVGEIINVEGNPFIVCNIGYGLTEEGLVYSYINVFKAGTFKLKIGGRQY